MPITITPTEVDVFDALKTFLAGLLPSGSAVFEGSITGNTLTVTSVSAGAIVINDSVLGNLVPNGTSIVAFGTGSGGVGTYTISPAATDAVPSTTMTTFVEIVQSQINRVPEPQGEDFITMNAVRMPRLSTNLEQDFDVSFTAAIAGTTMTVSATKFGTINIGATVYGANVAANTIVLGIGAPGQYLVSPSQNVAAQAMAAGQINKTQSTETVIQLDVHGPNSTDNTNIITTAFRSEAGADMFAAISPAISPLYLEDPRQIPFINAAGQFEDRWVIVVSLQVNYTITFSAQFADSVNLQLVDVDTLS
jgi:hypothetical protein